MHSVAVTTADVATIAGRPMAPRATLVATPGLTYWRTRRALTQGELAQLVGVNISTVARLERGATARLATVRKLAQVLKVEPGVLMDLPPAV
jgi:DNA-binding XRE family transcriptional regulator